MAKLNLIKKSSSYDPKLQSYRLTLEVTSAEGITKDIFVQQRIRNFNTNNFDDVFAAIATPAQLEDLPAGSPDESSTFFRTNKVDIISRNAAYLESVFEDILVEVQKLIDDVTALENLNKEQEFSIRPS